MRIVQRVTPERVHEMNGLIVWTETVEAWARFRATHPELYAAELRASATWPYLPVAPERVR